MMPNLQILADPERVLDPTQRAAAFFDRDGVLNQDCGFVHRVVDFVWIPGAREAIKFLNNQGFLVFVVTNQSGIARGYFDEESVVKLHEWMRRDLQQIGARIDDFRFCPHHPTEGLVGSAYRVSCSCRKPGPAMLRELMVLWNLVPERCFLIGDRDSDLAAATAAGICGHLFKGGNLLDLVLRIISH